MGSSIVRSFPSECIVVPRDQRVPPTDNVLYLISTVTNYNVFDNLKVDIETNLLTLMETLDHCRRSHMVFNFVSSWFVYGPADMPTREDSHCDPRGFYSVTKLAAEQLLTSFCKTFDIKYRILRLGNVYGVGDPKSGTKKNAITHMVREVSANRPVQLYEGGDVTRDMIHVDDAARAIKLIVDQGQLNTVYNVSSGIPTKLKDIIDIAVNLTHSSSEISSIPTPKFHEIVQARDSWLDVTKLKALGFEPEISIEQGIKLILQHSQGTVR